MSDDKCRLLCDILISDADDKGRDEKGRPIWAFDKPYLGAGMVTKRLVRVRPGEDLPIPFESYKDIDGNKCLQDGLSVVEYRDPFCHYCRTNVPEGFKIGDRCPRCGATEVAIEQMESLFFYVEPKASPRAVSLR